MRLSLRLRLIGAVLAAALVAPAFAGFAAAATCGHADTMPCCRHDDATARLDPGCCRIEKAPAQPQVPAPAPRPDTSSITLNALPAITVLPATAPSSVLHGTDVPIDRGVPLYLAISALRR